GDVRAVPVGRYAKTALENLGAWAAAEPKFAMADNVRAALLLVSRGEAALGIDYETDAKVDPGVKIVGTFPENSHEPVTYPVAASASARPDVAGCLSSRRALAAKSTLAIYGLTFLIMPTACLCLTSLRLNGRRFVSPCGSLSGPRWLPCRSASQSRGFWPARISGVSRCSTALCICRWCCRRS